MAAEGHVDYGMIVHTAAAFADTVAQVRQVLKEQEFGVLTEIDVRATLRDKLGEDYGGLPHPRRLQSATLPSVSAARPPLLALTPRV